MMTMERTLELSESYIRTITQALAHEGTPAAYGTLDELERQGVRIAPWILRSEKGTP